MSRDLLLEIGTEEVPAHFMPGILAQLKENAAKTLKELRLSYEDIRTVGTPRRSALLVKGLADRQADVESENRGPSLAIATEAASSRRSAPGRDLLQWTLLGPPSGSPHAPRPGRQPVAGAVSVCRGAVAVFHRPGV